MPSASPPPPWVLAERRLLGAAIRASRLRAKLTQEQVALRAGLDRAGFVRIELGQQSPTTDTLIRIAAAIGVTVSDLVWREGPPPAHGVNA
ncbi:helix-turn-helix domain-containing protein [Streptomyces sp. NPDC000345]|uniref:helix-turn-helix domain-containing protein n=1 Tax=Streptomyces sp. NPDC000345 TaxID=3364537 RepID=UPI00368BAFFE